MAGPSKTYTISVDWGTNGQVLAVSGLSASTQQVVGSVFLTGPASTVPGPPGVGVPTGGTANQVLAKIDGANYNTRWVNQTGGGGNVSSVFGRTGAVTATNGDYTTSQVTEGTNLYYTTARASGAAPVQSVAGKTGTVTLAESDIANLTSDLLSKQPNLASATTKTTSFTAVSGNYYPVDATSGAITATLPTSTTGGQVAIKKIDASANVLTLSGTINGSVSTLLLRLQNQGKVLIADGSGGWNVIAGDISLASLDSRYINISGITGGTNVSITGAGTTVSPYVISSTSSGGGTVSDATTTSKGIVQLAGDLSGTAASPLVPGLVNKVNNFPDVPVSTPGTLLAGQNSLISASGTYTAPTPAGTVTMPPQRFAVTNTTSGNITLSFPNPSGTVINLTVLSGEVITFRQTSTSGYINESGNKPLAQLNALYQTTLAVTNSGTSGPAILTGGTLNIPQYSSGAQTLAQTATKTAAYTALVNDLVVANASSGAFTVTLPSSPVDRTVIAVKKIDSSTNVVTVACSGSDTYTIGGTTLSLTFLGHGVTFQYSTTTSKWTATSNDLPLSGLDTRYQAILNLTTTGTSGAATLSSGTLNIPNYATGSGNTYITTNTQKIDAVNAGTTTYGVLAGAVNGSNKVFTVSNGSYQTSTLEVYLNGQQLPLGSTGDFTETTPASGTFTFVTAPPTGSVIIVTYNTTATSTGNIVNPYSSSAKTANYTANPATDKFIEFDCTSGNLVITLPSASLWRGYEVGGMKIDSSANTLSFSSTSSITPSVSFGTQYKYARAISNGSIWRIWGNN